MSTTYHANELQPWRWPIVICVILVLGLHGAQGKNTHAMARLLSQGPLADSIMVNSVVSDNVTPKGHDELYDEAGLTHLGLTAEEELSDEPSLSEEGLEEYMKLLNTYVVSEILATGLIPLIAFFLSPKYMAVGYLFLYTISFSAYLISGKNAVTYVRMALAIQGAATPVLQMSMLWVEALFSSTTMMFMLVAVTETSVLFPSVMADCVQYGYITYSAAIGVTALSAAMLLIPLFLLLPNYWPKLIRSTEPLPPRLRRASQCSRLVLRSESLSSNSSCGTIPKKLFRSAGGKYFLLSVVFIFQNMTMLNNGIVMPIHIENCGGSEWMHQFERVDALAGVLGYILLRVTQPVECLGQFFVVNVMILVGVLGQTLFPSLGWVQKVHSVLFILYKTCIESLFYHWVAGCFGHELFPYLSSLPTLAGFFLYWFFYIFLGEGDPFMQSYISMWFCFVNNFFLIICVVKYWKSDPWLSLIWLNKKTKTHLKAIRNVDEEEPYLTTSVL